MIQGKQKEHNYKELPSNTGAIINTPKVGPLGDAQTLRTMSMQSKAGARWVSVGKPYQAEAFRGEPEPNLLPAPTTSSPAAACFLIHYSFLL